MLKAIMVRSALVAFACAMSVAAHAYASDPKRFDVPAGDLGAALQALAKQSGVELVYQSKHLEGLRTKGIKGNFNAEEAVTKLLEGTPLTFSKDPSGAMLITLPKPALSTTGENTEGEIETGKAAAHVTGSMRLAQAEHPSPAPGEGEGAREREGEGSSENQELPAPEETGKAMPEILVTGSRALNMDIRRSRDDAQPYVIFERDMIEKSQAPNLDEFLKQRLPMNTVGQTNSQVFGTFGTGSAINLRGLGANQTLILIDGHRTASFSGGTSPSQADLNGIPMSAVDRIEVLPATASGIYGGSATGGVVNIILRRDYEGAEFGLKYDNTFETDSSARRLDFSAGFNLEDGRTNILLAGSYSEANDLTVQDREYAERGVAAILANNPAFFLSSANPPLGSTTNIRSANGSPLFGAGTPNFTSVPAGYLGGGGLAPLQMNAGQYNFQSAETAQTGAKQRSLTNGPTVESLVVTLRRQFAPSVHAFLEASGSNNEGNFRYNPFAGVYTIPANAPNNPFGQAIRVAVPIDDADGDFIVENRASRLLGGLILELPGGWQTEADYTWSRFQNEGSSPGFSTGAEAAAISSGTLDVLRDPPLDFTPYLGPNLRNYPPRSTLKDATLRFAGPVGSLPGGVPSLSLLLEHRDELFDEGVQFQSPTTTFVWPSRSQSVDSLYLEARLPIVSVRNRVQGVDELELQIAGRHDAYTVNGSTGNYILEAPIPVERVTNKLSSTNPTVGLRYQPVQDVVLRASYGTGFMPPLVSQLVPSAPLANNIVDPLRGNTSTTVTTVAGGNPNLLPEESKSWSAGIVLTPRVLPAFRFSVDYTRIEKTDNIVNLAAQQTVDNESILPGRVTRGPIPPGDPFGVGPITFLNRTAINIAKARVEAYDFSVDYRKETGSMGAFDFFALATLQTHYQTQILPTTPLVENAGTSAGAFAMNPLKLKGNAGLTWNLGRSTLGWTVLYFDSYTLTNATHIANQGSSRVPSQVYHDVFGTYSFDDAYSGGAKSRLSALGSNVLSGTEVQVGVKNIFNEEPPFDASSTEYYYSPFGDPRLATYYVSLRKRF